MEAIEFFPGATPVVNRPIALGRVFYVNHWTGNNDNNGIDPGSPFQTITYAISQCENDHGDYIMVMDSWDVEPSWPIVIDKSWVHIIGVTLNNVTRWPMLNATAGACFRIDSHDIEIAGFSLGASGGNPCILSNHTGPRAWIHACSFGVAIAAQDGILNPVGTELAFSIIEDCIFGQALTRDGVRAEGSPTRCIIQRCVFREYTGGVGINLIAAGGEMGAVLNNWFYVPIAEGAANGWAISTAGFGGMFMGNYASQTGDDTGNNPYKDTSTGVLATCLNGWAANYAGNALSPGPAIA